MRDSLLYFILAFVFAIYLTWRISSNFRRTLRERARADEEQDR
ncbi:hypothetical protein [Alicyclobacillus acidiphilus]|nr:hypothetical protein [Alicyclobacillus acidiphilus]